MIVLFLLLVVALMIITINNLRRGIKFFVLVFPFIQLYMKLTAGLPLQAVMCLLIAAFLIYHWINGNRRLQADLKASIHNQAIFLLCFLLLIGVIFNTEIWKSNFGTYVYFVVRKILLFYVGWAAITSVTEGNRLIKRILITYVCLMVYALLEVALNRNPILLFFSGMASVIDPEQIVIYKASDRGYRVQSIFYHPYAWGGILVMISAFYMYLMLNTRSQKKYLRYMMVFGIAALNIVLTRGRSIIFPFLFLVGALYFLKSGSLKRKLGLIAPIVIGAVAAVIIFPQILDVLNQYFTVSDSSSQALQGSSLEMRLGQLNASFDLIKEHPMVGNGFESLRKFLSETGQGTDLEGAESIWFAVLIDHGILGIIAYILFYIMLIRNFAGTKKRTRSVYVRRQINFAIVTILAYIIFITLTGDMNTFTFFLMYVGLMSKYIYLQIEAEKQQVYSVPVTATETAIV